MKNNILYLVLALAATFFPLTGSAQAGVGTVIMVDGDATVSRDASTRGINRGDVVHAGDTLHTGFDGRLQIRMIDKALLALRPNTQFRIDEYEWRDTAGIASATTSTRNASRMSLVFGSFRAVSGLIGKRAPENYSVTTDVATIGVRGTTYEALYCSPCAAADNGKPTPSGLYVTVLDGAIEVANSAGSQVIKRGEFGFTSAANVAPSKTKEAAAVFDASGNTDTDRPQQASEPQPSQARSRQRAVAGPDIRSASNTDRGLLLDSAGNIVSFQGPYAGTSETATFAMNGATNTDVGTDPQTGMRWGRWTGGTASVARADGSVETLDLSNQSLHWVIGPDRLDTPALPITGTAEYSLVGNTDPTNNQGAMGTLGSASLSANFSDQTVNSALQLIISGRSWQASGAGDLNRANAGFAGAYVVDADGTAGSGNFNGFFTGESGEAAGLTYQLTADDANGGEEEVTGAAVLERDESGQ